jgi:beta-fructofuranosidase
VKKSKWRWGMLAIILLFPLAGGMAEELTDPARPRYHFLPERNWLNDPNGLIQFQGEYHLFFQHNPSGASWANMSWGHARSKDLVHWERLPVAMAPDQDYDRTGVFSGVMVEDRGEAAALYTGVSGLAYQTEVLCLATTRDMEHFEKFAGNPLLTPPAGLDLIGFRDPFVFRDGQEWKMVIGAGIRGKGGAILLYRSDDLRRWDYLGPALMAGPGEGRMWECPNFFPLGDKWVFIYSPMTGRSNYMVGTFDGRSFTPERKGELDLGGSLYAPQVFIDDSGRRIMFGWLKEDRLFAQHYGWQGVMTLPRVLTLGADGDLRFAPAAEVQSLRAEGFAVKDQTVAVETEATFPIGGDLLEVQTLLDGSQSRVYGLIIRSGPVEQTVISHDRAKGLLRVDRSRSSLSPLSARSTREAQLILDPAEPLKLHVFLDRSVIEIFANDRVCLSVRIYPTRSYGPTLALFAEGGPLSAPSLEFWKLNPIW